MKNLLLSSTLTATLVAFPAVAETLRVGVATAQTGGLAYADVPVSAGMHLAVDEINAAGGIGGNVMIELIEKDVRSDAAQTSIATQELVDQGVSVVVLPCGMPEPAAVETGMVWKCTEWGWRK